MAAVPAHSISLTFAILFADTLIQTCQALPACSLCCLNKHTFPAEAGHKALLFNPVANMVLCCSVGQSRGNLVLGILVLLGECSIA